MLFTANSIALNADIETWKPGHIMDLAQPKVVDTVTRWSRDLDVY